MSMAATMSNSTSISEEASVLSPPFTPMFPNHQQQQQPQPKDKKKRSQPGNPDPDAEVIALSPKTLMTTNRYVCEICNKGFQRDQNLQLHRRGHNLPWKLRGKSSKEAVRKRVYVCPEESCVHHHPSRALGDLTGIKKHFFRKHGEKKWRCERCSKRYAVHSDWKAHVKTCGTREYRCDCGTLFSRKDSFISHRAFCDALAEETARLSAAAAAASHHHPFLSSWDPSRQFREPSSSALSLPYLVGPTSPHLSATALLQKAAAVGPIPASGGGGGCDVGCLDLATWPAAPLTRDFLGMEGELQLLGADRGGDAAGFRLPTVTGTWGP